MIILIFYRNYHSFSKETGIHFLRTSSCIKTSDCAKANALIDQFQYVFTDEDMPKPSML